MLITAAVLVLSVLQVCIAQIVQMPAGTFAMGNPFGTLDEQPSRQVAVSAFSLYSHEVTEAEYDSCVAWGACSPAHYDDSTCRVWNGRAFVKVKVPSSARDPRNPVVCVTWRQAREYCRFRRMSLPSEIQWEYAARAGTSGRTPWGDGTPSAGQCVAGRKNGPQPVGSCQSNAWGIHDMLGNGWEWVNDWYDARAYSYEATEFPQGPEAGIYRVIRGGGWYSRYSDISVSNRHWFSPDYSEVSIGFRCAGK